MKQNTARLIHVVLVVAVILSVVNVVVITQRFGAMEEAQAIAKEIMRPATLQVITLATPACSDCFDIGKVITQLKGMNTDITSEKAVSFESPEGKQFISAYKITKLPALIASGEVN